jgi:RNA polymerase sigma-70 factor (ECF subfamily)
LGIVTVSSRAALRGSVVEQAVLGDETAFARLIAAYHADMIRVAYVTCGQDADMAEDAVQSAWIIAWKKLASVRDRDSVKGWLIAVAANEARQLVRRRSRRSLVEIKFGLPDPDGNPSDEIDRVDLVNALRRLKAEDRMLLALRYVAGFDSTEIAERTGRSPSGTRARLGRLLDRLRGELEHG